MSESYYLRWKSQVTGPFQSDVIRNMLDDGRVTKHHQASTDRVTWTTLTESDVFRVNCYSQWANDSKTFPVVKGEQDKNEESSGAAKPIEDNVIHRFRFKPTATTSSQDRWFYADNGESAGPVTMWELRQLVNMGTVSKVCPICKEGENRWTKVGELIPSFWETDSSLLASKEQDRVKDSTKDIIYAGLWLRFFAYFIDEIIISCFSFILIFVFCFAIGLQMGIAGADMITIGSVAQLIAIGVRLSVEWVYFTTAESSSIQATLGKRACGLYVSNERGSRISFGQANGRYFGKFVSSLLFFMGFIMAVFTDRKQALHDIFAGTIVLRRS